MTRGQGRDNSMWDATRGIRTARFRLKPTAHDSGCVDGAWWPHSDDLMIELPGLVAGLSVRLGAISRVSYNRVEWRMTPAELVSGGRVIHLDQDGGQSRNTVEVIDSRGNMIALLVVPFHTDPQRAHAIVTAAAAPGDVSSVDALLMISRQDQESRTERDAARERWDSQCSSKPSRLHRTIA